MIEEKLYNISETDKKKKICLLSDIHYSEKYDERIFVEIINSVKRNNPDYICLVGDVIDDASLITKDLKPLINFIKALSSLSQVIITLGNHEVRKEQYNIINWFLNLNKIENVYFLNNRNLIRDDICFVGLNLSNKYYKRENSSIFVKEFNEKVNVTNAYYNVLLCHSPINILNDLTLKSCAGIYKIDLVLSGHMHNGLVLKCFDKKGNRGLVDPLRKFFPKYARGLVTRNLENHLINLAISGGVVKLSNSSAKHIRFLNKLFPISVVYINI